MCRQISGSGFPIWKFFVAKHRMKGVSAPIVGATKAQYLDDAARALDVTLKDKDLEYLEEPYLPHRIVGAIDHNPAEGVMLLDEKVICILQTESAQWKL